MSPSRLPYRLIRRLRANLRELIRSVWTTDYWLVLYLAVVTFSFGFVLLWPGSTLSSYPVYIWLADVPDWALALPMVVLGLWATVARHPTHRRIVTLMMCFMWGFLAVSVCLGVYHYTGITDAGPSGAIVHYIAWALLAFLAAVRYTAADASHATTQTDA